ncbi:MAG: tRNA (cytidine(56)-2'-O)-methyltransferase [Halobacteriales archaeon]|nr:tRNA (cytidine(56)-2'-O)-methyltransferase [Halobacteriales archaeon]
MEGDPEVCVVRLGHRPGRDDRMTTHVGLTARALGADRVVLPDAAGHARDTVVEVTERFGGPFAVETAASPGRVVREWEGRVAHLTMYGEPVADVVGDIRSARAEAPLLVVVGAAKVAFDVYEAADWNVGVTNQPHSEVAALAVFLDRLFEGRELDRPWRNAEREVVPRAEGKHVESVEPTDGDGSAAE